jgi:hypothetical protein
VKYGSIGKREGILPECYKGKRNTFGWSDTEADACRGALNEMKASFNGKNPSGCYCMANGRVNTLVQPFVCWVMFD